VGLATALAAWVVATAANAASRWANIPVLSCLLPGILLLVPGSLGFRSMSSLIAQDVIVGVQGALAMLLVAFALVTGLLLGTLTARPSQVF